MDVALALITTLVLGITLGMVARDYLQLVRENERLRAQVKDAQANPTRTRENRTLDAIAIALDIEEQEKVQSLRREQLRRVLYDCNSKHPKADAPCGGRHM